MNLWPLFLKKIKKAVALLSGFGAIFSNFSHLELKFVKGLTISDALREGLP